MARTRGWLVREPGARQRQQGDSRTDRLCYAGSVGHGDAWGCVVAETHYPATETLWGRLGWHIVSRHPSFSFRLKKASAGGVESNFAGRTTSTTLVGTPTTATEPGSGRNLEMYTAGAKNVGTKNACVIGFH